MPKSRARKKNKKKVSLAQVITESEFIIKSYNGTSMRVKNPNFGKTKTILHSPQKEPNNSPDTRE